MPRRVGNKPPAAAQSFSSSEGEPSPYGSSSFSLTERNLSNISARGSRFPEFDTLDGLGSPGIDPIGETKLVPFQRGDPNLSQPTTISTFSFLPSLRFPSIPRQLHIPLSLFDPDRFQVSVVMTPSELDLVLCVFLPSRRRTQISYKLTHSFSRQAALLRSRQFGIYLPSPKQNAVLRGDLSNTVVHPWFVHTMAGLGMYFCAGVGFSPRMVQLRTKHALRSIEQLVKITMGINANLKVQVLVSAAALTLHGRRLDHSRKSLTRACIVINAANLRFIPDTGYPPRLTEDFRERAVVLSQVIYFESYLFLAVDGTEPRLATRIEKEFRQELQVRIRPPTPRGMD